MKKIISGFLTLALIICLTACNGTDSETLAFGVRSAYTVSLHIGKAQSFVVNYIECQEKDENRVALIEAILYFTSEDFERHVYAVSTGGKYYEQEIEMGGGIYDETTRCYLIDYGDQTYEKHENYKLDVKKVLSGFNKFLKTNDLIIIGME